MRFDARCEEHIWNVTGTKARNLMFLMIFPIDMKFVAVQVFRSIFDAHKIQSMKFKRF